MIERHKITQQPTPTDIVDDSRHVVDDSRHVVENPTLVLDLNNTCSRESNSRVKLAKPQMNHSLNSKLANSPPL